MTVRRIDDPHAGPRRKFRAVRGLAYAGVAAAVIVFLVLPWTLAFLVTKANTRPDERNLPDTPATYGLQYEDVEFGSEDGNRLSGWYVPGTGKTTVVMSHGLFRSRFELLKRGCDLAKLGYTVLIYDLRRHGKSGGEFCTLGYMERHDVEAALRYALDRAPGNTFVLFGVSMGAAATLLAASEVGGVSAVVADSSFLSLDHTVAHHLELAGIPRIPFATELTLMLGGRLGYAPSKFDVLSAVRRIDCPVLFIGGTKDVRMPIDTVLEPLYDASANPAKRRFVVDGASHGHAYDTSPDEYVRQVDDFIRASTAGS
jgi:pimeloyl-ACP methyl ester carboxylesterase